MVCRLQQWRQAALLAEADFAGLQFLQQWGEPPACPPPLRLHSFMHVLYLYHRPGGRVTKHCERSCVSAAVRSGAVNVGRVCPSWKLERFEPNLNFSSFR